MDLNPLTIKLDQLSFLNDFTFKGFITFYRFQILLQLNFNYNSYILNLITSFCFHKRTNYTYIKYMLRWLYIENNKPLFSTVST